MVAAQGPCKQSGQTTWEIHMDRLADQAENLIQTLILLGPLRKEPIMAVVEL
jgi:hypothetical protein